MADTTHIEWTDATWNPVTGCSVVSPGCTHCYAMKLAGTRLRHHPSRAGLTVETKAGPVWNGEVRFNEEWIDQPLRWRRPRMIFVCAHGDLFHESVPDAWIDRVFAVMALAPRHTFQVLTKRSARMREYMTRGGPTLQQMAEVPQVGRDVMVANTDWPLPNVWLGVSAEDQKRADERVPDLLATPAAIRFVSAEPLLGPINFRRIRISPNHHTIIDALDGYWTDRGPKRRLDWIIVGGESGNGARPMHPDWARQIRDQCAATKGGEAEGRTRTREGTAFFFKQWGEWACSKIAADGTLNPSLPLGRIAQWRRWDGTSFREAAKGESAKSFLAPGIIATRLGKSHAGRLLDGLEHNALPGGRS